MSGIKKNSSSSSSSSSGHKSKKTPSSAAPLNKEHSMFTYYMENCYVLPLELKNDIIYCQRAMRDFLKVHSDPVQMQQILSELEEEVFEINAEQQYLLLSLSEHLEMFYKRLQDNNIRSVPELGNEYISSLIVPLISDASYRIQPQSVLTRDNEEMLIRKHFLLSQDEEAGVPPLKLSDLDESIPLMLVPPVVSLAGTQPHKQQQQPDDQLTQLSHLPLPSLLPKPEFPIETESMESRSLLIPRRVGNIPIKLGHAAKRKLMSSPPPLAPITSHKVTPSNATSSNSASSSTSTSLVDQSRINLRQALKRARKTKQQPRLCDEEDLELTSLENGKKSKASNINVVPKKTSSPPSTSVGSGGNGHQTATGGVAATVPGAVGKSYKTRNNAQNKSSPVPATASGNASSDDSTHEFQLLEQQRLCSVAAQWRRDEPRETRILALEYGQEQFLGLFGLYTHEVVKKLNQRHSKRKRRTVQNASGVDFHYGQQLAIMDVIVAVSRQKKQLKDKQEFLLSPKDKRLQVKKAQKAANIAAVDSNSNPGASSSSFGNADVTNRKSKTPEKVENDSPNSSHHMANDGVPAVKCKKCKSVDKDGRPTCNCGCLLECSDDSKTKLQV
ncbi:uncharacterized protein LOC6648984 isoform X2 [Drosophila willistoni]|uniref:uncharacterized protein LOC6648984 isoform X2 n=1 Tax=Drosophila willistoni TaxID=7260 RepID=UPI001F0863ED|nr:uncharacterized protein LOC6648984 isoform X2 [Drosophila willistoni]